MVGADAFTGLKGLRKLYLDSNHITALSAETLPFSKVPKLERMSVSENQLTTFERNDFTPPPGGYTEQHYIWICYVFTMPDNKKPKCNMTCK